MSCDNYEYIVVRSYTDGCKTQDSDLAKAFSNGYEFVRASEAVKNDEGFSDYIEYILRKEKS